MAEETKSPEAETRLAAAVVAQPEAEARFAGGAQPSRQSLDGIL